MNEPYFNYIITNLVKNTKNDREYYIIILYNKHIIHYN